VTFDIDANGILNVSAKDKATGKSQQIRIEASSGLTDAEIKKMKQEAELNAESDRKAKESVDKLNSADAMIFQTEKQLKEYGDKIPGPKKEAIENALAGLKDAYGKKDVDAIYTAMASMNAAWQAASEEMYKATQEQQNTQNPQEPPKSGGDEVTDVDFEEVKDDKK
jgi:molecular chaperone DnaK